MRIAMIADAGSVHTKRWAEGLAAKGHVIHLWSPRPWDHFDEGQVYLLPSPLTFKRDVPKAVRQLRREVKRFGPDVVHAHYISHYGLLAALAKLSPLVLSIWGADIECFPRRYGMLTSNLTRWILAQATAVTCSSAYLGQRSALYTPRPIHIIPFGIDLTRFCPQPPNNGPLRFVINKALEDVYGIDLILEALREVKGPYSGRILGEGSRKKVLKDMAATYGLNGRIEWMGKIEPEKLPGTLAWADVGFYASRRESFGVAPLEMMALGRTAIAHRLGGLTEVIREKETGLFVEPMDIEAWRQVIQWAVDHPDIIREMGVLGPSWVASRFNFHDNLTAMITLYEQVAQF